MTLLGAGQDLRNRPRPRPFSLLSEAVASVTQRPVRSGLTGLGTALGVAAFIAVIGITSTASGQISDRFTTRSASEVTIRGLQTAAFSDDGISRLAGLRGVEDIGARWDLGEMPVAVRWSAQSGPPTAAAPVLGVSDGYWDITRPKMVAGRIFRGDLAEYPVTVVGRALAQELGLPPVAASPTVYLGGQPFTVIGIIDDTERDSSPLSSFVVPRSLARVLWKGVDGQEVLYLRTEVGSASLIAEQAPYALNPYRPNGVQVDPVPAPSRVREGVTDDLQRLLLSLALVSLAIGAVGIANISLLGVMERTSELGLRRALGALRRHILGQVLWESAIVGAFGGVGGGLLGVATVLLICLGQDWTPVLDIRVPLLAPALGALVGLAAGMYPAIRAARFEPVEALRG